MTGHRWSVIVIETQHVTVGTEHDDDSSDHSHAPSATKPREQHATLRDRNRDG
jgi:hypothetical protein